MDALDPWDVSGVMLRRTRPERFDVRSSFDARRPARPHPAGLTFEPAASHRDPDR